MNKLLTAIAIILFIAPTVLAEGVSENLTKLAKPTLDNLKDKPIPGTSPVEYFPESAYTLEGRGSTGNNIITKYLKNADGSLSEKYYEITLKQTEYGDKVHHKDSDNKYFKWVINNEGGTMLSENGATQTDHNITYYVNNQRTGSDRLELNGNKKSTNYNNNFIGISTVGLFTVIASGGAISSTEGSSIGSITGDFIENKIASKPMVLGDYDSIGRGGAIFNYKNSTIKSITGDFIGNNAFSTHAERTNARGGAIFNYGSSKIGSITGDFIGNHVHCDSSNVAGNLEGGAIYNGNDGSIDSIKGNFISNQASSANEIYAKGGAIHNTEAKIGNITGNFISNYTVAKSGTADGGAIYNIRATIGNITGDFIGNYAICPATSGGDGGAIYNTAFSTIGNITGDFIGNYISADLMSNGGAIVNNNGSKIGNITGDFIGNHVTSNLKVNGGAICNEMSTIGNITGDFINNHVTSTNSGAFGGAISIYGTNERPAQTGEISGSFINNYAKSYNSNASGGAIHTNQDLSIVADNKQIEFTGNYTEGIGGKAPNAIYIETPYPYNGSVTLTLKAQNNGSITFNDQIVGDSEKHKLVLTGNESGKIFFNNDIINANITLQNISLYLGRDDVLNKITSLTVNSGSLSMVNKQVGTFELKTLNLNSDLKLALDTDLSAETTDVLKFDTINNLNTSTVHINELNVMGDMKSIDGSFTSKFLQGTGADSINSSLASELSRIYTQLHVYDVKVNNNELTFTNQSKLTGLPGAIADDGDRTFDMNADESVTNWSMHTESNMQGDKLVIQGNGNSVIGNNNVGIIVNGTKTLTINNVESWEDFSSTDGGAINNTQGTININDSNFSNNTATTDEGGAINNTLGTINIIDSNFSNNTATTDDGGAINNNQGTININDSNFSNNTATTNGGAINNNNGTININDSNFSNNTTTAYDGGAINNNNGTINIIDSKISNNTATTNGGAINNNQGTINIIDSNFSDNTSTTNGGAINNSGIVNIIAEKSHVTFENNTVNGDSNAIHNINNATLNLNAFEELKIDTLEEYNIIFNDKITSDTSGVLNINASKTEVSSVHEYAPTNGTIVINNDMSGFKGDANLYNGTIKIAQNGTFFGAQNFNVHGGTLDLANGLTQATSFNNLKIVSNSLGLIIDADLAASTIDTIRAANTISDADKINVTHINLLSDALDKLTTLNFTDDSLKAAVTYTGKDVAYSDIHKYAVKFNNSTGNFEFSRYSPNTSDGFNPSILAAPVAAQLGGYLTQLNSYDQAFMNMDMYMLMTKEARQAMKLKNKYAAAGNAAMTFSPLNSRYEDKGIWFKPYSTFENVPLRRGPKVSNVAYGSFFGGDSELHDLGHGWDGMFSVYAGYNGSHQAYQGISMYQNGGTLGASGFAYKDNFFTGLTVNVGASAVDASTMFGSENFAMLMGGVASKTGYNWELAKGKFIIQPSYMMSYSFVNTFDYRNAAGVKMDADLLNAIQIEPGVKFIGNLKNGWQPYIGVSMVWNIMDRTKFKANDVSLPDLSVKPFVRYGIGIQKLWGDRFTGYLQTFLTSGGRNGVGIQCGFRWRI